MKFFKRFDAFYCITLIFLLLTSNANFLSANNAYWFAALFIMIVTAVIKKALGQKELRQLSVFSLVYLLFIGLRDVFVNNLEMDFILSDVIFLFKYILVAFSYITLLKKQTITYLVRVMTDLTVVSLFFYCLQMVGFADTIYRFSGSLNLSTDTAMSGYTNFVVYTYIKGWHDYQNSGFVWEPGAFGCFLSITLLLHLLYNEFRFDKQSKILLLGILTTLSTTNYLALLIILFLAYRFRYPKQNKWLLLIVPLVIIMLVTIPILGDKIGETYYQDMSDLKRLTMLERYYHKQNQLIPLNRFASMTYVYQTFDDKLLLGVCNKYDVILNRNIHVDISNGIADFLARFGLIGFAVLLYQYSRFCYIYLRNREYVVYCILIFLFIGIGEPLLQLPVTLIFLFLASVYTTKTGQEKLPKKGIPGYERSRI